MAKSRFKGFVGGILTRWGKWWNVGYFRGKWVGQMTVAEGYSMTGS